MDKKLITTSRIWESGNSPVITIPLNIKRILGVEVGDSVIVEFKDVIKKSEMDEKGLIEIEKKKQKSREIRSKIREKKEELPEI